MEGSEYIFGMTAQVGGPFSTFLPPTTIIELTAPFCQGHQPGLLTRPVGCSEREWQTGRWILRMVHHDRLLEPTLFVLQGWTPYSDWVLNPYP